MLAAPEISVRHAAGDDERRAWATGDQVFADSGDVILFTNTRDAAGRHIEASRTLPGDRGVPVPENRWPGRAPRFASASDAREAAVTAQAADASRGGPLPAAANWPDIVTVLRCPPEASRRRHVPAFRRRAERSGEGHGPGGPRRRRHRGA